LKTTLAIDFGSQNIGIALVKNGDGQNTPLFAGTLTYDTVQLKKKLNPRPQLRRMRRTRKTKRARLGRLRHGLQSIGLDEQIISELIAFCRRRGWKSLFGDISENTEDDDSGDGEILFRHFREDFFKALETLLRQLVPGQKQHQVLTVCESVLNRYGDPHKEIRRMRIDNRGSSRCAWDGCERVTPRRDNAIKDALAQFVYVIIDREKVAGDKAFQKQLDHTLSVLEHLGKRYRNAGGHDPLNERKEMVKAERKTLNKKIGLELKPIKELSNAETWSGNRANIINILKESRGRNRYCRFHSAEFVRYWMAGKRIPFKASLKERDIVSRREEVLFQRLWRYIEARILPLASNGIDRLVVERVAFDLLAGKQKQRLKLSDEKLERMYQHGPRYGFKNEKELLKAEYDGLCAYCGKESGELIEREHILPKREFIFDSYLNLVPSCPSCNRQLKAGRSPGQAGLKIHPDAFQAFSKYVAKQKPPHHLHTIKKGILKLMTDEKRTWEAEQYLALVAKNYMEITGTQRGPRPLARYLSEKIFKHSGKRPAVVFCNGRHTALLREAAYPDFDKTSDKAHGGKVNHALDALVLACDLPSPTALEGLNLPVRTMKSWTGNVRKKAPAAAQEGIPRLPLAASVVSGFEEILDDNYIEGNLALFNWNRKNAKIHRQDIYGWNAHLNMPTRRTAAAELAANLVAADKQKTRESRLKKVDKVVDNILHPQLKAVLMSTREKEPPGQFCADALTKWLKKTIRSSLKQARFSYHPADQSRKKLLEDFVSGKSEAIPAVIGIKMLRKSHASAIDVCRIEKKSRHLIHRYWADPAIIAKIVGYKKTPNGWNRDKPVVFDRRQSWAIVPLHSKVPPVPDGPLKGRHFGEPRILETQWTTALETYLKQAGIGQYNFIRQGTVVIYENGEHRYIRNFSTSPSQGFKNTFLKRITGVKRSPFADKVMENKTIN